MNTFSISQLSKFTGVKPHTIRIWEQRYAALKPQRSKGNTRNYDGNQLRRLLNIVSLLEFNYRISELGPLPDEALFDFLKKHDRDDKIPPPSNYFVSQLISAGMDFDEPAFEKLISHCFFRFGIREAYSQVLVPLLDRLGLMWTTNTIHAAHEHFISNIVRQKLYTSIDCIPPGDQVSETWLLFLPENEFHDLGLLMAHYLLRSAGKKTIFLGADVPREVLFPVIEKVAAKNLLLFLSHYDIPEEVDGFLKDIKVKFPENEIYLAGNPQLISEISTDNRVIKLNSAEEFEKHISTIV